MIASGEQSVTLEELRQRFPDFLVASKYLGVKEIPSLICSPLREDKSPSLSIYESRNTGHLRYKDFGTGESGSLYMLLSRIWGISVPKAIRRVWKDNAEGGLPSRKGRRCPKRKPRSELKVKLRDWKPYDMEYWESYGISLPWLRFADVYPVSQIIVAGKKETEAIPADKYAYCYAEGKDGKVTFKIYQPFSKYKWMSKHDSSVWDLWAKIPERGEKVIICSSRKDALCVWENTGIPCLSLQGEGYIPKPQVMEELKSRYDEVIVLYDNDFTAEENHGRNYGRRLAEMFNVRQIELPESMGCKDPSDFCRKYGRKELRRMILSLVNG